MRIHIEKKQQEWEDRKWKEEEDWRMKEEEEEWKWKEEEDWKKEDLEKEANDKALSKAWKMQLKVSLQNIRSSRN